MSFYAFLVIIGLLLILFAWSVRKPGRRVTVASLPPLVNFLENCENHATYFSQIQQALAEEDDKFLRQRGLKALARKVRTERHRVAVMYLKSLQTDFQNLLGMAKTVAALSPNVTAMQEWERARLTLLFYWRYEIIRMELLAGFSPLPQVSGLANVVSGLSVQMENAIKELDERAAIA